MGVCFTGVGLCMCLSVNTITKKIVDGFVSNFMGRLLGEREDQVRVSFSLRSVEGCGSNGQKTQTHKPTPVKTYSLAFVKKNQEARHQC